MGKFNHISEIESLRVATGRIPLLEFDSAAKDVAMDELRSQLAEIAVQNNELKAHAHEQQLELVKCTAVVETQKTILTELQGHLGVKKRE